jgi:hypothetical protein
MNMEQAQKWIAELDAAIEAGKVGKMAAYEEVFAEMAEGDHSAEVETFFYNYTQGVK